MFRSMRKCQICRRTVIEHWPKANEKGCSQAPCGTCKSSPIEKIFYEHTSSANWNTSRTQTDRWQGKVYFDAPYWCQTDLSASQAMCSDNNCSDATKCMSTCQKLFRTCALKIFSGCFMVLPIFALNVGKLLYSRKLPGNIPLNCHSCVIYGPRAKNSVIHRG